MKKTKVSERPIFAQNVIRRRKTLGWTQSDLANKVGLHLNTIKAIEVGESEGNPATRRDIAQALGVSIGELFASPTDPIEVRTTYDVRELPPEDAILIVRNVQISHFSIKHPNLFIKIDDEEIALSPITKISSCRIESVGSFCQQEYPIKVDTLEKMNSSANVKFKLILADNKYVEGELPEAGSRTRNGLAEFLERIKNLESLASRTPTGK